MRTTEELIETLKEELKKDMSFERHRMIGEAVRMLEELAAENRALRNTVKKMSKLLQEREGKNGST